MKEELKKKKKNVLAADRAKKKKKRNNIINAVSILAFFCIWQAVGSINQEMHWFNPVYLPTPLAILQVGYEQFVKGTLLVHLYVSLKRIFMGVMIGVILSFITAILFVKFSLIEAIFMPVINFIGPVPIMALLPAIIIWFGIGESSKLFIVAYGTFMSVLGYAVDGMKNTDPLVIRSAMSLGASQFQLYWYVIIPSALPNIFAGIKSSLSASFSAMVVAEMMGATEGLGFLIINAKAWFKMNNMFLAIMLIGLLYTIFYNVVVLIEKYLFKWRKGTGSAIEE